MKKLELFFSLFISAISLIFLINIASALETYTDEENNFKVGYPSGWVYYKDQFDVNLRLDDLHSTAEVEVSVFPSLGYSLAEIADETRTVLNQRGYHPYNEKDVTINNLEGFEWRLSYTRYTIFNNYEEKQVYLLSGDKYYIIAARSFRDEYEEHSNILDQIINSFKIIIEPTIKATIRAPPPTTKSPGFELMLAGIGLIMALAFRKK